MGGEDDAVVVPLRRSAARNNRTLAEMFTVKDVAVASGLPQPVVAQLVPRTETAAGAMYTVDQLNYAIQLGDEIRSRGSHPNDDDPPPPQ